MLPDDTLLGAKPCATCGVVKVLSAYYGDRAKPDKRHSVCISCTLVRRKQYYYQNREDIRVKTRAYYQKNRDMWLRTARAKRQRVLEAYGGKCMCCGESTPEFLGIDHVDNDGEKHRRELKGYGRAIYDWLARNGYPQDGRFQLLCHNCNMAKGLYGLCPHQGTPPYKRHKDLREDDAEYEVA